MAVTIDIDPLLSQLYDAVLDPALWPDAWAQASAAVGSAPLMVVADGGIPVALGTPGWMRHAVVSDGAGGSVDVPATPAAADPAPSTMDRAVTMRLNQHLRRAVRLRARLAAAQTVDRSTRASLSGFARD